MKHLHALLLCVLLTWPATADPLPSDTSAEFRVDTCASRGAEADGQAASVNTCVSTPADYFKLLSTLDRDYLGDQPFAASHIRTHLSALDALLPSDLKEDINLDEALTEDRPRAFLSADAGTKLAGWWRSQDPFPATASNERLLEHLSRVKYASKEFAAEQDEALLDDRGKIYVRYGEPKDRVRFNLYADVGSFSEGQELWVYSLLHPEADYLFLHDPSRGFLLGQASDVVKRRFGGPGIDGISTNPDRGTFRLTRQADKAFKFLERLAEFYEELSLYKPEYGIIASDLRMPTQQLRSPASVVNATIESAKIEESARARVREEVVPSTRTYVGENLSQIPLNVRAIRRLDDDRQTTVDVYWSAPLFQIKPSRDVQAQLQQAGHLPSENFVLAMTVVEEAGEFQRVGYHEDRALIRILEGSQTMQPQVVSFPLQSKTRSGAAQLDAYWAEINERQGRVSTRAKVGSGAVRVDDLQPLSTDPGTIEMSDLLPRQVLSKRSVEDAPVYPYAVIRPSTDLALDFEIYNLVYDENDQTDYTITYSVQRRVEREGTAAWFGRGEDETETVVESRTSGVSRSTKELVDIQLNDWNVEDDQQVRVVVTVNDNVSQDSVQRTVEFTMLPERDEQ